MAIKRVGMALASALTLLVVFLDYRFYTLRCEVSPEISAIGACFAAIFQMAAILVFASCFEGSAAAAADKYPRLPTRQAAALCAFLLVTGCDFMHSALLASDAVAVRGSRSSGEDCPGPHW